MTSTFTILCPNGIVMATDSRITLHGKTYDDIRKVHPIMKNAIGISYWGYVALPDEKMVVDHLANFEKKCVAPTDTVDDVAEKLKKYLENITPKIKDRGGFHLAGCIKEGETQSYRLRHVFHETWHEVGKFTNENCHNEWHDQQGNKRIFDVKRVNPVLFNGDNFVANALFNYAPIVNRGFSIKPELLSLEEAEELSKLILETAVSRLTYFFGPNQRKAIVAVGGKILRARITCKSGFEWIAPNNQSSKEKPKIDNKEVFEIAKRGSLAPRDEEREPFTPPPLRHSNC